MSTVLLLASLVSPEIRALQSRQSRFQMQMLPSKVCMWCVVCVVCGAACQHVMLNSVRGGFGMCVCCRR